MFKPFVVLKIYNEFTLSIKSVRFNLKRYLSSNNLSAFYRRAFTPVARFRSGLLCEPNGSFLARNGTVHFRGVVARFRVCNLIELGSLESIYQFASDKSHQCMKSFFGGKLHLKNEDNIKIFPIERC